MFPRARDFAEVRVAGRGEFEDAVRDADVVHATTAAQEPVVRFEWLRAGAHVSSVGSSLDGGSELDPAIVDRADVVVVEQRDSAFAPLPAGAPELDTRGRDGVVELGEIIAGTATGRASGDQITLYKSVGVAVQDLAAAALVLRAARDRGAGQEIELEEIHA
jgi:ornithine cyclodeaminase/alanine dehydrogenase-like protein (mu-crystallin family)